MDAVIVISEVWNAEGRSVELVRIPMTDNPRVDVMRWISANRPELDLASGLYSHGYHARAEGGK